MPPWLDPLLTVAALAAFGALAVLANHRMGQPFDPARPRVVPWGLVLVCSVFAMVLALVHGVNLLGVETGPENSLIGGF